MKFEVPQFIEIEDKIFGPFTWRQFLYLAGGGGWGVAVFLVSRSIIIFIIAGLPVAVVALLLAFVPINNQPFSRTLESMYNYFTGHKLYLWQQKRDIVHKNNFIPNTTSVIDDSSTQMVVGRKSGGLASVARQLELKAIQKK
jgi:hypothetical protein